MELNERFSDPRTCAPAHSSENEPDHNYRDRVDPERALKLSELGSVTFGKYKANHIHLHPDLHSVKEMSLLARAPRALLRQQATRSPLAVSKRNMSGDYHHLPFKWPGDKKGAFATKLAIYMISGFSIPFVASYYQLRKAAA